MCRARRCRRSRRWTIRRACRRSVATRTRCTTTSSRRFTSEPAVRSSSTRRSMSAASRSSGRRKTRIAASCARTWTSSCSRISCWRRASRRPWWRTNRGARSSSSTDDMNEQFGKRLWLLLLVVVVVAACLDSYGIRQWPMADDEVPSLVEMGLYEVPGNAFSVPAIQLERLPKALPVWYAFQCTALRMLPHNEFGFRIPSLVCALIVSGLTFVVAARWRGLWFGLALAIILNLSQPFVFLAQIDRFYSMPLLLLTLTLMAMCSSRPGVSIIVSTAVLTTLTVLSHNVTVAVFVLTFIAASCAYVVRR